MRNTSAVDDGLAEGIGCVCHGDVEECVCPSDERILRAAIAGKASPFTPERRAWALAEIARSSEGSSVTAEHETWTDADLSRAVLGAWLDYARDKGIA